MSYQELYHNLNKTANLNKKALSGVSAVLPGLSKWLKKMLQFSKESKIPFGLGSIYGFARKHNLPYRGEEYIQKHYLKFQDLLKKYTTEDGYRGRKPNIISSFFGEPGRPSYVQPDEIFAGLQKKTGKTPDKLRKEFMQSLEKSFKDIDRNRGGMRDSLRTVLNNMERNGELDPDIFGFFDIYK